MDAPTRGFVFWPVGNGDSTTIFVESNVVVQIDLRHLACAEDDGDPNAPVVDELVKLLPRVGNKPYLSAFALTHGDSDHCTGFPDLLQRVTIGELWFTPQILIEAKGDLCSDAIAFRREALRRVKATIAAGGNPKPGDRVRIIGWDEVLNEPDYKGFPRSRLTVPGKEFTDIDGRSLDTRFRAFVHAPFKEDLGGERNDSSLGLQIALIDGATTGHALLLGDLCYPTVRRIFGRSKPSDVAWNVLLSPHHCSKSVMYWETLRRDVVNAIQRAAKTPNYIVASSTPIPFTNAPGDLPPHAKAKDRYSKIAGEFFCTMEHPNASEPQPIVFDFTSDGLVYRRPGDTTLTTVLKVLGVGAIAGLLFAIARGLEPPKDRRS